jgi:hypothetical protein
MSYPSLSNPFMGRTTMNPSGSDMVVNNVINRLPTSANLGLSMASRQVTNRLKRFYLSLSNSEKIS